MQPIKTLIAVSVVAAAGFANAATVATFDVALTGGTSLSSTTGSGTGTLDDSGVLTMNLSETTTAGSFGSANTTSVDVFNGTYASGIFTASSGNTTSTSCSGSLCSFITLNSPTTFNSASGTVASATGGALTASFTAQGQTNTNNYTLTPSAPAVPVPAAAWLFGSGLLGLAGTARRRVKQAV